MAPLHVESQYRWPFDGAIAKFTSKLLSKEKLPYKFELILDGHDIHLKNFIGRLQDLMINDVVEGAKVSVQYIPISYFGRKPGKKEDDDDFPPGCTLKLVSITLLEVPAQLDTSSPSKGYIMIPSNYNSTLTGLTFSQFSSLQGYLANRPANEPSEPRLSTARTRLGEQEGARSRSRFGRAE